MARLKSSRWMSLSYNFQMWGLFLDTPITQKGSPPSRLKLIVVHIVLELTPSSVLLYRVSPNVVGISTLFEL